MIISKGLLFYNTHCYNALTNEFKQTLKDLGYIKFVKEDNEWHAYIIKELDF